MIKWIPMSNSMFPKLETGLFYETNLEKVSIYSFNSGSSLTTCNATSSPLDAQTTNTSDVQVLVTGLVFDGTNRKILCQYK